LTSVDFSKNNFRETNVAGMVMMSAFPGITDIQRTSRHVRFVPVTDFHSPSFQSPYGQATMPVARSRFAALAILKLMTSSNAVGRSTGISATAVPRKS
jgi:hypothetical protein